MTPDSWFWKPWDALNRLSAAAQRWERAQHPFDHERAISEARAWRSATDLKQLGMLGAEWLNGNVLTHSTWDLSRPPDPETEPLIDILARLNRAGFVTIDSQPGLLNARWRGAYWHQRAFVHGFAPAELVEEMLPGLIGVGLNLTSTRIRRQDGEPRGCLLHDELARRETVVTGWTTSQFRQATMLPLQKEITWIGGTVSAHDVRHLFSDLSDEAYDALLDSRFVTIYDKAWGRESELWAALEVSLDEIDIQRRGFVNAPDDEVP